MIYISSFITSLKTEPKFLILFIIWLFIVSTLYSLFGYVECGPIDVYDVIVPRHENKWQIIWFVEGLL